MTAGLQLATKANLLAGVLALTLIHGVAVADSPPEPATRASIDSDKETGEAVPVDGISTSGQPSEEALAALAAAGYAAVIDLRGARESRGIDERKIVEDLGMRYVNLPVLGAKDVNFDKATELDALLHDVEGPVLIHCASGNRVGALLALRESLSGSSIEDAVSVGKAAGLTRLEAHVREVLMETKTPPL